MRSQRVRQIIPLSPMRLSARGFVIVRRFTDLTTISTFILFGKLTHFSENSELIIEKNLFDLYFAQGACLSAEILQ